MLSSCALMGTGSMLVDVGTKMLSLGRNQLISPPSHPPTHEPLNQSNKTNQLPNQATHRSKANQTTENQPTDQLTHLVGLAGGAGVP